MTSPAPTPPGAQANPPPSWLRGLGLVAYTVVVLADVIGDGRLDTDGWSLMLGAGLIIWGPPVLRSVFRRDG